ncbi:MAG: prepilin-type N-terminal cleavage/methylation domain-containing protein [Moraxella sp.]|nr:prepilin-type N-terminal cleavage/methylation domain-containing protein [Moraxella sp.]
MSVLLVHPPRLDKSSSQAGFGLIELLIVIIIIGILTAVASPNISAALDNQRNKQTTDALTSAFRDARTESQLRRQDVTVVVNDAANNIQLTIPSSSGSPNTVIREFAYHENTAVATDFSDIVFKFNKIVIHPNSSATDFSYQVTCNEKTNKKGSLVEVDNNGNVKIGGSRCS